MPYLRRQLISSALVANAVKPLPGVTLGLPAMAAGWWVCELAPHVLAATATDTLRELRRGRRTTAPLLGLTNVAALAYLVHQSHRSRRTFEAALDDCFGGDHVDRLRERHDDLDWRTPLRRLAWPFHLSGAGLVVHRDLPYEPDHGSRGRLDVYRPAGDVGGRPVLLQVHGGAWTIGDKGRQGLPLMRHLASRGWVCVAPNYRLSPRAAFPEHLVDVKRAIAWVREHIHEYGGDPSFLAITGGSAGGHLATLAALTANDPRYQPGFEDADTSLQAAVPFYAVYDVAGVTGRAAVVLRDRFIGPRVMFADPHADRDLFERASPLLQVGPDAPPFYVIHGANDTLIPVGQARAFVAALRRAGGAPVAYCELPGTQHAFDVLTSIRSQHSVRSAERFLRWVYDAWSGPGE